MSHTLNEGLVMPSTKQTFRLIATMATLFGLVACRAQPATVAEPVASALVVRNTSVFDINVFALVADGGRKWLVTVPANSLRSLPILPNTLRTGSTLVVQTQAIGAASTWTSAPVKIDANVFALLDLAATSTGDCSQSLLNSVTSAEMTAALR